jgi:hypothetical protein
VAAGSPQIELGTDDLRAVTAFAAACASRVLPIFESESPADSRARDAIAAAIAFAAGGPRTAALRSSAWAAFSAAREAGVPAASHAARAAGQAAAAAYLHPLADAHQVKHILGPAALAARAAELEAGDDPRVGEASRDWARDHASDAVRGVLARYPSAPPGGGRVGELIRELDAALRLPLAGEPIP